MKQKRKFRRLLLIATGIIGIIGVLVTSLVVLFSYTPNTSVPFPYISPPANGYVIETALDKLTSAFTQAYGDPAAMAWGLKGETLIFKNVELDRLQKTTTYMTNGVIQFVARNPQELKDLKKSDVVDIIGVVGGLSKEWPAMLVVDGCQFLPAGLAALPLPGGPVLVIGGY